ncbi:helix-turn-helix domain-containing protein [Pseudoduganella eburnea]|uniref:Helix-turn-helix domain-containing protein n=1 Tax=Massilia eburnea TaxID=1776165 RepID=A0A6L6QD47_9BURK|nr:helix-turn-helix domain-containing protein [Massilia eburnea]MTW10140.1 helix-turn-helix domain-containing protein [Massilia eburnea]
MANEPIAKLIAPRLSLASCIRAHMVRSTLDCPLLESEQRVNRYPATPFCSIYFQLAGDSLMIDPPPPEGRGLLEAGMALVTGPRPQPMATRNSGPTHFFMVMFFPDAFYRLTGLDMGALTDNMLALPEALGPEWQAMAQAVHAAPDDQARVAVVEDFMDLRWRSVRKAGGLTDGLLGDWVRRLTVQAAAVGFGRSARMAERRVREWAGQPMRSLRRMQRAEQAFVQARDDAQAGRLSLGEVAHRGGYSDQAHLSREARGLSGISPSALLRERLQHESYWVYRIWT